MKTLILIRHGETEWNTQGRIMGNTDIPLSRKGRCETEELREQIDMQSVEHVFTSTSMRTVETAEILTRNLIPITRLDLLKERAQGILEGLTRQEIQERYREAWDPKYNHDPWFSVLEKRETLYEVLVRVMQATNVILNHPAKTILVVTHGTPARLIQYMFAPRKLDCNPFELELHHTKLLLFRNPRIYTHSLLE